MQPYVYQSIKNAIMQIETDTADELSEKLIKYVSLYRGKNLAKMDAQYFPAVFVEFPEIEWTQLVGNTQVATVPIALHLFYYSSDSEFENHVEEAENSEVFLAQLWIAQAIYYAMQSICENKEEEGFSWECKKRISHQPAVFTPENDGTIYEKIVFEFYFKDASFELMGAEQFPLSKFQIKLTPNI